MTTTDIYVQPFLDTTYVVGADSNLANAKANLLDSNMNTYWQATTSGHAVVFDTNPNSASPLPSPLGTESIDAFGFWIKNNTSDYNNIRCTFRGSNDKVTYSSVINYDIDNIDGSPIVVQDITALNYRYYRISFNITAGPTVATSMPQISQVFILKKIALNARPHFTLKTPPKYFNNLIELEGGQQRVSGRSNNKVNELTRVFNFKNSTDMQDLTDAYDFTIGTRNPFIYQEGTTLSDMRLCRFASDSPEELESEFDFDFFSAIINMRTLQYIKDGDTF